MTKLQTCPPVETLLVRLHAVEAQIRDMEAKLERPHDPQDRNRILSHISALTRRQTWYVRRIRRERPIQTLSISTVDEVRSGDSPR